MSSHPWHEEGGELVAKLGQTVNISGSLIHYWQTALPCEADYISSIFPVSSRTVLTHCALCNQRNVDCSELHWENTCPQKTNTEDSTGNNSSWIQVHDKLQVYMSYSRCAKSFCILPDAFAIIVHISYLHCWQLLKEKSIIKCWVRRHFLIWLNLAT